MEPILNGAPGFILLAFVVALAGYLRQVSMNAQERAEQLESNKHPDLWPPDEEHTLEKISLLGATRSKIEVVTRPLFGLMVIVSLRAVLYALSRIVPFNSTYQGVAYASVLWSPGWLRIIDLFITLATMSLVIGMWFMHAKGKRREREVRNKLAVFKAQRAQSKGTAGRKDK